MVHFVFAGKPDCKKLAQVLNVAYYLCKNLPHFEYKKIDLTFDQWDEYLVKINREQKWHHIESPLVYKEVYYFGTKKPVYIGGISEFWEYCYDYYGLECIMSPDEIEKLVNENLEDYAKKCMKKMNEAQESLNIMVYGATNEITTLILPALMMIEGLGEENSMRFILYDEKLTYFDDEYFEEFNEEFKEMFGKTVDHCDNLGEGLKDTNLLIIVDNTSHLEGKLESLRTYLLQIYYLAEEINLCGRRDLRIIFASYGMSCLIATILARKIKIPHSQVVVVASDLGLGYLGEMCRRLNIAPEKLGAPPVWGSIGLNAFVDAGSALMKCNVRKPYPRAVRATPNSTLTHGTMFSELRFVNYLSDDIKDLKETVERRRAIVMERLEHAPQFAKIEALVNLVKIWYGCSTLHEPIISLGVMSDGSFNIPQKIIFAQPAIQFRGGWVPFSTYPVPDHILRLLAEAGKEAETHYQQHSNITYNRKKESFGIPSTISRYKSSTKRSMIYIKDMLNARSRFIF